MEPFLGSFNSAESFGLSLGGKNPKILNLDNLIKLNIVIVNGWPMCLNDEETGHHLLIHCHYAYKLWTAVINLFDMEWVMPSTVADLFVQWQLGCKFVRAKILWKYVLYATI